MISLPASCGIYAITNTVSGKVYIGSSINIKLRVRGHMSALKRAVHSNPYLQNAYNADGRAAFVASVVELCDSSELLDREQRHLDSTNSHSREIGYNICASAFGKRHSDETKERIRLRAINRSDESRERYASAQRGKKASEETKAKQSAARKGRKHSPEARAKIAESNRRRTLSDESKAKIGAANRNPSAETRAKQSASHQRPLPQWWRDKIAATLRSPEVNARLSASAIARCQRKREQRL